MHLKQERGRRQEGEQGERGQATVSQTHFSGVFRELCDTLLSLFLCSWVPAVDSLMRASLKSACGDLICSPEREDFPAISY